MSQYGTPSVGQFARKKSAVAAATSRKRSIVRPYLVEAVRSALAEVGVVGMTISEVRGIGRQKGHAETYRGSEYKVEMVSKTRIEVALPDELLEAALEAVVRTAKTGKLGDGKVFVTALDDAVRIRTGEHGEQAL